MEQKYIIWVCKCGITHKVDNPAIKNCVNLNVTLIHTCNCGQKQEIIIEDSVCILK